jgi:hypothetical protein
VARQILLPLGLLSVVPVTFAVLFTWGIESAEPLQRIPDTKAPIAEAQPAPVNES